MTIPEMLLLADHYSDHAQGNYAGNLTRKTVRELQDWMAEEGMI